MSWWQRADGKFQYSLRSRNHLKEGDDSFDVSELAKLMGGGGHKNAAGFESDHMLVF
jgi:nanoRNase/pAp phosphatase (c-di-AMP/oligoRNAs hydrolase)